MIPDIPASGEAGGCNRLSCFGFSSHRLTKSLRTALPSESTIALYRPSAQIRHAGTRPSPPALLLCVRTRPGRSHIPAECYDSPASIDESHAQGREGVMDHRSSCPASQLGGKAGVRILRDLSEACRARQESLRPEKRHMVTAGSSLRARTEIYHDPGCRSWVSEAPAEMVLSSRSARPLASPLAGSRSVAYTPQ